MNMEPFMPTHGVAFWLLNIFAVVIIWVTVEGLIKGTQKPVKTEYMQALGITPEEADFLFKPTTDRLYNILRQIRGVAVPIAAILFLVVTYVPGAAAQAWLIHAFQFSAIMAGVSQLFIALFRGRTSAKVNRLSNVDNFKLDPVTGELPKASNIYAHDILIGRIGAFMMLLAVWWSLIGSHS
jgi:hypothetical protein